MSDDIPCIVIGPAQPEAEAESPDALKTLVDWLCLQRRDGDEGGGLGTLLQGLVLEGRAFASTPSGARWRSVLAPSAIAANGWLIWNGLDLDRLIAGARPSASPPGERAETMIRVIGAAPLEAVMRALSDAALSEAAQDSPT